MKLSFSKYEGAGNDFILVDGRKIDSEFATVPVVAHLCDRHFGIGADGFIILYPSDRADFRMKYFNSDGREGTMCGNGGRCMAAFARRLGVIGEEGVFEAIDGLHQVSLEKNGRVTLQLNDVQGIRELEDGYLLDTGSPHFVTFTDGLDDIDVFARGRVLRNEPRFREGVNINFTQLLPGGIRVRTYERGVEEETLSCGTGITAAAMALVYRDQERAAPVSVNARGGSLTVDFVHESPGFFTQVKLAGPATFVFDGTINI